jgi:tRNA threonylcarbamoyl adenosine modification protein YeaZ
MLSFAMDTSSVFLSVAVFEDNDCIYSLLFKPSALSKIFIDIIDKTLKTLNIRDFTDFEKYYITTGPGKYTSLRVGIATLKGLLYEKEKMILNINALDLLATNMPLKNVISVIPSSFPYVYYGIYHTLNRVEMGKIELEKLGEKIKPDLNVLCPEMHKIKQFLHKETMICSDKLLNVPHASNMLKVKKYVKGTKIEELVPTYDVRNQTV